MENSNDKNPYVYIIILNWNGLKDTLECLESINKINYPNFDVIVADNGSSDGSIEAIRSKFPDLELLDNGSNLGFAEGNNRAIEQVLKTKAEYVLVLNNDTIVDQDILSALVKGAELIQDGGIFGPKMYHYDEKNTIWYAGGYWDPKTLSFEERGAGMQDEGQFNDLSETEWVVGCAMFIRTAVFKKVGLLEAKFFLNNEEIDFCSRTKHAGYSCVFVPDAKLWHKISVSFGGENSPMKEYFITRNRLLWTRRNADIWLKLRIYLRTTISLMRRFSGPFFHLKGLSTNSVKQWWWYIVEVYQDPINRAFMLGIRDFVLGRFGNCPDKVRDITDEWLAKR